MPPTSTPRAFISYRIADAHDLVGRLDADLTRELGAEAVFRDKTRLGGGCNWTAELERNAKACRVMLVVIGPDWQTAPGTDADWTGIPRLLNPEDWVRKEITFSLDAGNIVIPVLLNGTPMPPKGWLARCELERLWTTQALEIRTKEYDADFVKLINTVRKYCPELAEVPEPHVATESPLVRAVPVPPALYAVPAYTLTSKFVGRRAELRELDTWGKSPDAVMVVEAIGGEGKSALTWEWLNKKAEEKIPDLAGRLWWSFYEGGTSMQWFVRCALAYTRGVPVESLKELSTHECAEQLLVELRLRPFLLVLDGFERVLTAYHRIDKAQVGDDGIPKDKRECINPPDGELLKQLVHCSPSKILISSRLMPIGLEDPAGHGPIPGVQHLKLEGLSEDDALDLVHSVGVKGDDAEILGYANQFGRHALVLRIVCGMVTKYHPAPGDFGKWLADPCDGARVELGRLDVKQRKTHILGIAFDGLAERTRLLLSRIAALSDSADYETVAALNPFLPPRPEPVEEPDNDGGYERRLLERAKTPEERTRAEERLRRYQEKAEPAYLEQRRAYEEYRRAVEAYPKRPDYLQAKMDFRAALDELIERGLLQWDRHDNSYELISGMRCEI